MVSERSPTWSGAEAVALRSRSEKKRLVVLASAVHWAEQQIRRARGLVLPAFPDSLACDRAVCSQSGRVEGSEISRKNPDRTGKK